EDVDRWMSRYRPDSDVSQLNDAAPGVWVGVHAHTRRVLRAAQKLYRDSDGVFDIRCAGSADHRPALRFRGTSVSKTGPWTIDLGGIAKGYAVDLAVSRIQRLSRGHSISGIVNAGGDLRRWGPVWPAIAVATSLVRTPLTRDRLTPALHV